MKRIKITGIIVLAVLLLTPFMASSAGAVDVIRNGNFDNGLSKWVINPEIDPMWDPLLDGTVSLHPRSAASDGFTGTVIHQNLNVTGIAGSTFAFSMDLLKNSAYDGKTISVFLTYVDDSGNVHEIDLVNPANADISDVPAGPSHVTQDHTFPDTAAKLIKIEIEKCGYGDFTADNISLTTAAAVAEGSIPAVTGLSADSGVYGTEVTITGSNFGSTQGFVSIGGLSEGVSITNWSDTSITATIAEPARSGKVYVVADYVESNIDFTFNVTSPHFTVDIMDDDITVIKGQIVDLVLRVDFFNGFTTAGGISFLIPGFSVPNPLAEASFLPDSPLMGPGGVVVRIDTSSLPPGDNYLTVQSLENDSFARLAPFLLEVLDVSEIKFVQYDASSPPQKSYITSKTVPYQGQFGEQSYDLPRVSYEIHCTDGSIMSNDAAAAGVTLTSGDPRIVGAYKRYWGYDLYALQNGTTTLHAQAPDGTTADLGVTVDIPTEAPQITSISLTPSSVSNKEETPITFEATSNDTPNQITSIGYDTSGYVHLSFDLLDNSQYNSDHTVVTSEFHLTTNPPADIGTAIVSASATRSDYDGSSTAALPLTTFNDSTYSGLRVAFKALDLSVFGEMFDIEFYYPGNTAAPAFTKEIWG